MFTSETFIFLEIIIFLEIFMYAHEVRQEILYDLCPIRRQTVTYLASPSHSRTLTK